MTALYQAHALGLIRLGVVMLGDRPTAEDVVQEAFYGLYRRWHALSEETNALAYVRSSVINGCRSALRRRVRQLAGAAADQPEESASAVSASAESAALLSEEYRQVLLAIRRLPSRQLCVSPSPSAGLVTPASSPIRLAVTAPECQLDSIITPDGSGIVCGAIAATGTLLHRGAETEFIEYSSASGKMVRILGHWTFRSVGALSVDVLWSDASGRVLIGVIPDSGGGRLGVISGNEFTPLPGTTAAVYGGAAW